MHWPHSAIWSGWELPDWVSVIGFPLGIVAFGMAWWQLGRTKKSADAARDAVRDTQRQLADNHLLVLVPQLVQAQRDVQTAADRGDHEGCQRSLDEWRDVANNVKTLLRKKGERADLVDRLAEAVAFVVTARDALEDHERSVISSTAHARDRIRSAGDRATEIVTERMAFVEADQDG